MSAQRLNRVHTENLCHLIELRDAIVKDPLEACLVYGIDRATAESYAHASDEALRDLAFSVDESLFVPRLRGEQLRALLKAPPEVRGIAVAVSQEGTRQHNDERRATAPPRVNGAKEG